MRRIVEPELMDDESQGLAYAQADFSEPNKQFLNLFAKLFPAFAGKGRVLDLGCGPADILVRFVRRYPGCRCLGIDGAQAMLAPGLERVKQEQLKARIDLHCCCLPLSAETGQFEVILSNSLLHHLHNPDVLWQTLLDCSFPGTYVLLMDLFRPATPEAARKIVTTYAGEEPEILQTDFYNSLLAAFRVDEVRRQLTAAGLGLQCSEVSDRHLAIWGVIE